MQERVVKKPLIVHSNKELEHYLLAFRSHGKEIGFVPTMGALHKGHLSLIARSLKENEVTVCSIFVNPTQFNDNNDLANYPRMPEKDTEMLGKGGCDVIFIPSVSEIYPPRFKEPEIDLGLLDKVMEGKFRPGHFKGVVTVVARFFDIVKPTKAYFGLKDFQQVAVIKEMVKQRKYAVEIVECQTLREPDGLAMSSRNMLLSIEQRANAAIIPANLLKIPELLKTKKVEETKALVINNIDKTDGLRTEYLEIADAETLQPVNEIIAGQKYVACIAVKAGNVRLIDNVIIS